MKTTIILKNEVAVKLTGLTTSTRKRLNEKYSFLLPYARNVPAFKLGRWDGKVNFFTFGALTYINLLDEIIPILLEEGYEIEIDDKRKQHSLEFDEIDEQHFAHKKWPASHQVADEPIILRDYQVDAINLFLTNKQSIQCIATGGGKTLITAALSNLVEEYGRTIVIVPSKSLVTQTEEDYINLGLDVGVYFGDRKEYDHQHTICTWQSLASLETKFKNGTSELSITEFLTDVIAVIVDECHGTDAAKLKNLLGNPFANVPIRWGFTGTIPKEDHKKTSLLSFIGPIVGGISAATLQEMEVLSNCHIHIKQLLDNITYSDYQVESKFLGTDKKRLSYIANYLHEISKGKNTLVLVNKIATGESLVELLEADHNVVFVSGATKNDKRKEEYDKVSSTSSQIVIGTYGVAAIGLNIVDLHNIVILDPGKSFVRVIQSIGRGLRRSKHKDFVDIHDITSNAKFSKRHLTQRKKFYKEAGYEFSITKMAF